MTRRKKWKKTPARLASARRNIKKAQAARLAKRPKAEHLEPLRKDVPFEDLESPLRVADRESELDFYKRQTTEYSSQTRRLTDELVHLRRLANFIDWMMRKS